MERKIFGIAEMAILMITLIIVTAGCVPLLNLTGNLYIKMAIQTIPYFIMLMIPFVMCLIRNVPYKSLGFTKRNLLNQILIALLIAIILVLVFVLAPIIFGAKISDVLSFKPKRIEAVIFYFIYYIGCVGFGEEIFFRGYIYTRIKDIFNNEWAAIIGSSFLFGLLHYPLAGSLINVLLTSFIGLVLCVLRVKVKDCSLLSVALAHGLYDSAIFGLSCLLL